MPSRSLAICVLVLACSAVANAAWSTVQWVTPVRSTCFPQQSLTCTIPLDQAIGSGHPLTVIFLNNNDAGNQLQRYLLSVSDCTSGDLDGNGNCTLSINTWVLHHNGGSDECRGYAVGAGVSTGSSDCATVESSSPGGTHLTITRNTTGVTENYDAAFAELSTTAAGYHLDSVAGSQDDFNALTHTMVGTTVTGNDAIVQGINSRPVSISSPYGNLFTDAHFGWALALNYGSGAGPTWTGDAIAYDAAGSAAAWVEDTVATAPAGAMFAKLIW